jgi:hypothetical protein
MNKFYDFIVKDFIRTYTNRVYDEVFEEYHVEFLIDDMRNPGYDYWIFYYNDLKEEDPDSIEVRTHLKFYGLMNDILSGYGLFEDELEIITVYGLILKELMNKLGDPYE